MALIGRICAIIEQIAGGDHGIFSLRRTVGDAVAEPIFLSGCAGHFLDSFRVCSRPKTPVPAKSAKEFLAGERINKRRSVLPGIPVGSLRRIGCLLSTLTLAAVLQTFPFAVGARAQFIGFTSPQTVGPITCINAASVPTTSSPTPGAASFIPSLGQTVHYVTYTSTSAFSNLSLQLDGSIDGTNWFRISEISSSPSSGALSANVYLPFVRCNLTRADPNAMVTAVYTGTSVSAGGPSGLFGSIYTRAVTIGGNTSFTNSFTIPLPNLNTAGTIYLRYFPTGYAGATLTVEAGPDANNFTTLTTLTLANVATAQPFTIPGASAAVARLTFTTAGPSTVTYDLFYSFTPGSSSLKSPAFAVQAFASDPACSTGNYFIWFNSTTNLLKQCDNGTIGAVSQSTGLTSGSVPFIGASGLLSQDNVNLFWDDTAKVLFVNTASHSAQLTASFQSKITNQAPRYSSGVLGYNTSNTTTANREIYGIYGEADSQNTSGTVADASGVRGEAYQLGAGTRTNVAGVSSYAETDAGTATNLSGFHATTNARVGGTVTNNHGMLIENQAGVGTNNWAIKTGTGLVGFGDIVTITQTGGSKSFLTVNDTMPSGDILIEEIGDNIGSGSYFLRGHNLVPTDLFWVKGDGSGFFAGNVGVGTAAPASALSVGNATLAGGDFQVAAGKLSAYAGVATLESGVPATHWNATSLNNAANIAATNLIASATAGRYRLSCYTAVTQQATTSSTVPDCNLVCTDPTDSVAKTIQITPAIAGVAANPGTSVAESGSGICDAKAATAVQYSTSGYLSVGATAMQYKIYVVLEAM